MNCNQRRVVFLYVFWTSLYLLQSEPEQVEHSNIVSHCPLYSNSLCHVLSESSELQALVSRRVVHWKTCIECSCETALWPPCTLEEESWTWFLPQSSASVAPARRGMQNLGGVFQGQAAQHVALFEVWIFIVLADVNEKTITIIKTKWNDCMDQPLYMSSLQVLLYMTQTSQQFVAVWDHCVDVFIHC